MIRLFLLLSLVSLGGCATLTKPKMESPAYLEVLAKDGVDPGTYARIAHGRVLGYGDIMDLVRSGIPGKMSVPYLQATKTPYDFSTSQINALVKAGADHVLVNYLGKAKGIYLQDGGNVPAAARGGSGWADHPYFTDPYYMGMAPFGFGFPGDGY